MKEKDLKAGMKIQLKNEKSLIMDYDLNGIYIIDFLDKEDKCFVRSINGPLGIRYLITKNKALENLVE